MSSTEEFAVGARCYCEGFYATIRFVGEVPPAKGVWLGVEWDLSSRGKHSGDHEGIQYFTCSSPGSGSFVRPRKVSLGYSFVEALRKRYGVAECGQTGKERGEREEEEEEEEQLYVVSRNRLVTPVEMVGADKVTRKQSQLDQLSDVSVREMLVSTAGPQGEIAATAPNILFLDLSRSFLLHSWETVADICRELPKLRRLNVSENRLPPPADPLSLVPAFTHVTELSINKMKLSWKQVCSIAAMLPCLIELHSCENSITSLSSPLPLKCLRLLNLEENQLSSWAEVLQLNNLPKLETLILNDNQIPEIFPALPESRPEGVAGCLPHLRSLSVSNNSIHGWSSVTALAALPSLCELRIKGNPLFKGQAGLTSRELVIARLPQVKSLNNSQVGERERLVAERFYLKHYSSEWAAAQSSEEGKKWFRQAHPRYAAMVEAHNIPLETLHSDKPAVSALKDSLLSVTVQCPDHPEARQLTKRLPQMMTVQKLKGLLQRVYRVDSSSQRLSYLDSKRNFEIELDDDLRQLSFYSIQSGDTILLRW